MRRILRWLVNGLCLLSLLACVGVGWLWWEADREQHLEAVSFHTDLAVDSSAGGLILRVTRGWPGGAGAWAGRPEDAVHAGLEAAGVTERRLGRVLLSAGSADVRVRPGPDATPARRREMDWLLDGIDAQAAKYVGGRPQADFPLAGARMRYWEAGGIPHLPAVIVLVLPPLLWLSLRSRRLYALSRRRRLGLCLRCGYDLTGNTSGVCSECGRAIEGREGG